MILHFRDPYKAAVATGIAAAEASTRVTFNVVTIDFPLSFSSTVSFRDAKKQFHAASIVVDDAAVNPADKDVLRRITTAAKRIAVDLVANPAKPYAIPGIGVTPVAPSTTEIG